MRRILAHLDDVGVSRGSVEAWKALRAAGVVRSASVMVPCPYYRMAVEDWRSEPSQDLGIHITLTSEWSLYRWRPLTGPVAGLTDAEGYFHRRPEAVAAEADPAAVADEIAAQIERALADGISPTHLDAHMGTAYLEPFIGAMFDASDRYGIPLMLVRDFSPLITNVGLPQMDFGYLAEAVQEAETKGLPVLDRFLIDFCPEERQASDHFSDILADAGEGNHWLALHANAPDDMGAYAPHMTGPRVKEFELFGRKDSRALFEGAGSEVMNWPEWEGM